MNIFFISVFFFHLPILSPIGQKRSLGDIQTPLFGGTLPDIKFLYCIHIYLYDPMQVHNNLKAPTKSSVKVGSCTTTVAANKLHFFHAVPKVIELCFPNVPLFHKMSFLFLFLHRCIPRSKTGDYTSMRCIV